MNEADDGEDEDEDRSQLESHHYIVGRGRLANAAHQNDREDEHDEERGNVEPEVPAGMIEPVAGQVLEAVGKIGGRDPLRGGVQAEPVEQVDDMRGKSDAHAHIRAGILQDQIPADDPGDELTHRSVGVGVSRAGNGNHRRQFRVAEPGERANRGHQHQRQRDSGTRAGTAGQRRVGDDEARQRRVHHAGCIELFARDGRANDGKNARADDRTDPERRQRPRTEGPLEPVRWLFRVADELVDRLAGKQLAGQGRSPYSGQRSVISCQLSRGILLPGPRALRETNVIRNGRKVLATDHCSLTTVFLTASTGRAPSSSLFSSGSRAA